MSDEPVRTEDVERAAACVTAHAQAAALGAFAYDILATQAEGRSLFAGQKFMSQRAESHGVTRDGAATDLGNLLAILERGPAGNTELALVAAFAVHGFGLAWSAAALDSERSELVTKWVAHCDWLQIATGYRVMPFVERLLSATHKQAIYDALVAAVRNDDTVSLDVDVAVRARNAARLTALASAPSEAARPLLTRLCQEAKDPTTRAVAAALLGDAPQAKTADTLGVNGRAAAPARRPWLAVLRWLTGIAILQFALRVLCFLIRLQRSVEVELDGRALRVRRRTSVFGRVLRSANESYEVARISGARRLARFGLLRTVVGTLALTFGVLLGGLFAFEGARGGAPALLGLAALVTAFGTGLDLVMDVLADARRSRVELQIDLQAARPVRVAGVPLGEADRLLHALAALLAGRSH